MYIFPFEIIGTALGAPHVAQANGRFCAGVPASSDGSVKFTPVHELFPDAQSRGSMEIPPPTLDYTVPDSSRSDVGVLTVPLPKAAPAQPPLVSPVEIAGEKPAPSEPGDTAPVTPTAPESTVPGSPVAGKKSSTGGYQVKNSATQFTLRAISYCQLKF